MAVTGKPAQTLSPRLMMARVLIFASLLLVLISAGLGSYIFLQQSNMPTHISYKSRSVQPAITISDNQAEVRKLGQEYMSDLMQQQYDRMWSALHPQIRAIWPNKLAFSNYWQGRFRGYKLQKFVLGQVRHLSYWINPETMQQFTSVEEMPISLQIVSLLTPAKLAELAPQFQHPDQIYRNLPFIVQQSPDAANTNSPKHWNVLEGGPADLEAPILPPQTPLYKTVAVPILMYHHIANPLTKSLLDISLAVTPGMFSKQLDYLQKNGYHTITLNQLMDALYYEGPLPKKPIILTFDDGYDDAYKFVYPMLKAHSFSGVFYIITGKVGWQGQATWPQLREMLANGMQMGSHTIHHVDMGDVYQASPLQAAQEVQISQMALQDHLGMTTIQHFCYPNGGPFKGHNTVLQQEVVALLAKNGYTDATTDPGPTGVIQSSLSSLALLRIRIDGRETLQQFVTSMPF